MEPDAKCSSTFMESTAGIDFPAYYEYDPLPPQAIRLFRLQYGFGFFGFEGQIHINLEVHYLDSASFDALSYTWGTSTLEEEEAFKEQIFTLVPRCYPILCEGRILLVTRSLRDALRRLHAFGIPKIAERFYDQFGREKSSHMWADGICINQSDLGERAQQVAMMGDVYKLAKTTLAYVGEPDEGTRPALETAVDLSTMAAGAGTQISVYDLQKESFWAKAGLQPVTKERWLDWACFMSRAWFFRTWILQEALIGGSGHCVVMCGDFAVPLFGILQSLELVYFGTWQDLILSKISEVTGNRQRNLVKRYYNHICLWLASSHPHLMISNAWKSGPPTFSGLCRDVLPYTLCCDPRDKIYGSLGIAAELTKPWQSNLRVDYAMPYEEVYSRWTKALLFKAQDLEMLTKVGIKDDCNDLKLPSWCPDYWQPYPRPQTLTNNSFYHEEVKWSASGASKFDPVCVDVDSPRLIVRGCCSERVYTEIPLKTVTFLTGLRRYNAVVRFLMGASDDDFSDVLGSYHRVVLKAGHRNLPADISTICSKDPGKIGRSMAYELMSSREWKTDPAFAAEAVNELIQIIEDVSFIDQGALLYFPKTELLRKLLKLGGSQLDSWKLMAHLAREFSPTPGEYEEDISTYVELIRRRSNSCGSRHLFRTGSGRIGMGHETLRIHDEIWLLAGSKVPFLLRPRINGHYQLIGECYVDGLMMGEQWPTSEEELIEIILE